MDVDSNISNIAKIIGEVVGARILEMAHNGEVNQLNQLGLKQSSYQVLTHNLVPTDVNIAVSKSIMFSIDEQKLLSVLNIMRQQSKKVNLLNKWIRDGASFEMCRHFFKQHTNRKHTSIRTFFNISNLVNTKTVEDCIQDHFNDYLYAIDKKRPICASDLEIYILDNKVEITKVWFFYKKYNTLADANDTNCHLT